MWFRGVICFGIVLTCFGSLRGAENAAGVEFFEKQVRPILTARCHSCHGAEKQESDLRLDSAATAKKGGVTGAAIVPGKPDESLLLSAISYKNEDLKMPPKGPMPAEEAAILRRWVELGAPSPNDGNAIAAKAFDLAERKASHWCWQPVRKPVVPAVRDEKWPRGEIDRFILARLEEAGLKPAPDADRRTLIRRVYFDLIGLPPSRREVTEFLADQSPDAFEKVVDRLLASPRFGERWARHWFDLVRYAETYGHEQDFPIPHAWQYRDYVIRALNADVPYDQFVREHIAGDLLPTPRRHLTEGYNESIIATGFWFMYEQTHAPTDVRQHEADRVDNQIDVMTKAFLGITVGCARCHDHKFDAISTRDYYALAGFLKSSRQQVALLDPHGTIENAAGKLNHLQGEGLGLLREIVPQPSTEEGQKFAKRLLAADTISQIGISHPQYAWSALQNAGGNFREAHADLRKRLNIANADRNDPARTWLVRRGSQNPFAKWFFSGWAFSLVAHRSVSWTLENSKLTIGNPEALDSGALGRKLQGVARSPTFTIPGKQLHVRAKGNDCQVRVIVDNYMLTDVHQLLFAGLNVDVNTEGKFKWITINGDLGKYVGERAYLSIEDGGDGEISIAEIVFCDGPPPADPPSPLAQEIAESNAVDSLNSLAARYAAAWNEMLAKFHASNLDADHVELLNWALRINLIDISSQGAKFTKLQHEMHRADESLPAPMIVLAMTDGTGRDEFIYLRGKHQTLGSVAPRRFLEAIDGCNACSAETGSGRLELARRITDAENPLFARTAVNRLWHHLFGRGLAATVDNLGVQGEAPTHPELLDWLAAEFIDRGWSQKQVIRELVLSRTYQMASLPGDGSNEQRDPANRLWHRSNVRRLEGEAIRDAMLAVSGRLDSTMFGPSVPAHLSPFSESKHQPKTSGPLDGEGRRSVYLEVRRNFLPPMLIAFDTPTPFTTVGRRNVSNVPAQALTMLNDPLVASLAKQWAEKTIEEHPGASVRARAGEMYETALCRLPSEAELQAAEQFFERQGELLGSAARDRSHEIEIWSDFAHVLFNHKEFVLRN